MKKEGIFPVVVLSLLLGSAATKGWGQTALFTGNYGVTTTPESFLYDSYEKAPASFAEKGRNIEMEATATAFSANIITTDCPAPGNLTVDDITHSGATISWTSSGASEYEYAVITSSTPPASGTLLQAATTVSVSGLLSATYYYLHVRSTCGATVSNWATSEPFRTADAPISLITWVPSGQMNFGANPFSPTTADTRITVTGLTRGAGVQTATSGPGSVTAANDAWGGYGWQGADDQDIQFTVTANQGYTLSLSSLQLSYRVSSTGPPSATLTYAIGNGSFTPITTFTFTAGTSGFTLPAVNLGSIPALQNLPAETIIRFRILPAAAGTNSGTFYIYNEGLAVNGTVSSALAAPVPDPVTVIHPSCFTAAWSVVPGATNYFIDVYKDSATVDQKGTTVAGWSFKTDLKCNSGIATNLGKMITTVGANAPGISSETARAEGWHNGSGSKYWEISFSTANYYNLNLSSKQRSSDRGPRDFKLQYKIGAAGTYTDVPGGVVPALRDNYTAGVISNLSLPAVCENQPAVYVRWIMASNTSVDNSTVSHLAASNIDDILITGNQGLATTFVAGYNNLPLGNVTTAQITGLTADTKHYFVVRAEASGITTKSSTPVTVTTINYTTAAYRSRQSGVWNSADTWDVESGCNDTWTVAPVPPAATTNVSIQSGHTVTLTSQPIIGNGKALTVNRGGTLVTGTSFISGAGAFVLQPGSNLSIGSPDGISSTGNTGNIRVTGGRIFDPAANYTYAGTGDQLTGTGLPAIITGHVTIANTGTAPANTVSLTNSNTTLDTLNLYTPFSLDDKSLTIVSLTGNGTFTGSKASSLTLSGGTITLRFTQTTDTVTNALGSLLINGGNITLGNKLAIYSLLNIAGGTLDLAGKPLVLKSNRTGTARVAEIRGTLLGATAVTVERFIPQLNSRKWRLITSPVTGTSINSAWQEGMTFHNGTNHLTGTTTLATPPTGYGTLITGHGQGTAAKAANNGFDFWDGIAMAASSLRRYQGAPSPANAGWAILPNTTFAGAFDNCQAYLLFVRGDRSVSVAGDGVKETTLRATGTLRQGTQHLTIYGSAVQSHTLIGNPFAAPLHFDNVYRSNPGLLKRYFWVLNSGYAGQYGAYQVVYGFPDGTYQGLPKDVEEPDPAFATASDAIIHSGSAFLAVPAQEATVINGLRIEESHKATLQPGVNVFRAADNPSQMGRLYVNLREGTGATRGLLDGALALWDRGSNPMRDDVAKAVNGGENLSLFSEGKDFIVRAAESLKAGDTLPLRIWNTGAKSYWLETNAVNLQQSGLSAFLYDRHLQTKTPLSLSDGAIIYTSISMTTDSASRDPHRFGIVFEHPLSALPLLVSHLRVWEKSGSAVVEWKVEDESGIRAYEVERSNNAHRFFPLAVVDAGRGAGLQLYQYVDRAPAAEAWYRIRIKGEGGQVAYSPVLKLTLQKDPPALLLWPNPVKGGALNLHLQNKPPGHYLLSVYNAAGQRVLRKTFVHPGGSCVQSIGLNQHLAEGFYMLELKSPGNSAERANFQLKLNR